MELKRVVVTGLGALTPIGNDAPTTWNNALNGVSGAGPITRFDASLFKTQFACEVKGYNSADHFDRKELRKYDLYAQFGVVAAKEAVKDSGLEEYAALNRDRVGVLVTAGIGGLHTFEEEAGYYAMNAANGPKYNPFFIPKMIADMAAGHISMLYGYRGPNYATVSACASSTHALIDAFNLIRLGKADAIITGGAEAAIYPAGVGGFNSMHALSTRNDDPQHASRPFSGSRDGFVMGEGAGIVVLEELEHAKARGAHIYAEVVGYGTNGDAYHITAPAPGGIQARKCMELAIKDAGIDPKDVNYINAHGTSTGLNDQNETLAIKELFGDHAKNIAVNSTKSMTGHLLGAAGAIETIVMAMAIETGKVHPTINCDNPDEGLDLDYVREGARDLEVKCALSNSFGFGGHNGTLCIRRYEA